MLPKASKTKSKPTSRGQRKHVRRMKQEARKASIPDNRQKKVIPIAAAPKEQASSPSLNRLVVS